jgi:hypothetical protein
MNARPGASGAIICDHTSAEKGQRPRSQGVPGERGKTGFANLTNKRALDELPDQKISTRMFNSFSATKLASHGYVQVDSASVRDGDIVVRTSTTQPNRDGKTGKYHFKSTWGTVTTFFRPIV